MPKLHLLTAASAALIIGYLFSTPAPRAESLSCASANGVTRCSGSGGLDCQTVEGRMVCAPGAKGSCETTGEVTVCRNGSVTQTFRTGPRSPKSAGDGQKQLQQEHDSLPEDSNREWLSIEQGGHGQRLSMEQLDRALRMLRRDAD